MYNRTGIISLIFATIIFLSGCNGIEPGSTERGAERSVKAVVASLLFSRMTVPILYFLDKRWESRHDLQEEEVPEEL